MRLRLAPFSIALVFTVGFVTQSGAQQVRPLNAQQISQAAGAKATIGTDGVVRTGWPRTDVRVTVEGMPLPPSAGLESWAAFTPTAQGAVVVGDNVLFQDEVTPAMDAAFEAGLDVTALHNHFFYDEPRVYFMHIGGTGDPVRLAAGVKAVWDAARQVRAARAQPALRFSGQTIARGSISAEPLQGILGHETQTQDGVVKVIIARAGKVHGVDVGGSMGLTTWAAFSGTDELAAVDGDFIMTSSEVQPVLRALRKGGIHIVALHNHMVGDDPAFYFAHFWGRGSPQNLAQAVRAALDAQAKADSGAGAH